jgi:hypothetical protein
MVTFASIFSSDILRSFLAAREYTTSSQTAAKKKKKERGEIKYRQ